MLVNVESTKRNIGLSVETAGYHLPPNLAFVKGFVKGFAQQITSHCASGCWTGHEISVEECIVYCPIFFNNCIAFTFSSISRYETHIVCQRCMLHCIDM